MQLDIITPDKKLFSGEVRLVQVPGTKGSFAVLENHAPIISTLQKGKIKVIQAAEHIQYFEIKGGMIEVLKNKITILAE